MQSKPELSIVIPVGPGEKAWQGLIPRFEQASFVCQIILAGCEPPSADLEKLAAGPEIVWLDASRGRAAQVNQGVAATKSEVIWILHADSRPGPGAMKAAAEFSRRKPGTLGWFDLTYGDDPGGFTRLNAWGANWRSRLLGLPFGDQGWLMPRALFLQLGGLDEGFGRGEDLDFIVRAHAEGIPLQRIGASLETSARRYVEDGWTTTTLAHLWLTLQFWLKSRKRLRKEKS
ncbi:MAG: glycosyltransferase [Wenzhouxiangellaceae bacterium]|nr:glycosyltransferase [Wenzhouxiangellaceae bacterium]